MLHAVGKTSASVNRPLHLFIKNRLVSRLCVLNDVKVIMIRRLQNPMVRKHTIMNVKQVVTISVYVIVLSIFLVCLPGVYTLKIIITTTNKYNVVLCTSRRRCWKGSWNWCWGTSRSRCFFARHAHYRNNSEIVRS